MYNRKLCCKVPVVGPQGPQGPQGEQGATGAGAQDNAILFFANLGTSESKAPAGGYDPNYDHITTTSDGIYNFMSGTAGGALVTFTSVPNGNYWVEFYAHCDAEADNTGTDNYITFRLVQINLTTVDSIRTIDIDTRSVSKGDSAHLSFGPTAYKFGTSLPNPTLSIDRNATYGLQIEIGRPYFLSEIKLIIKVRPYV